MKEVFLKFRKTSFNFANLLIKLEADEAEEAPPQVLESVIMKTSLE